MSEVETWHHGLVARWWAEFNHDGPEIAWFQRIIETSGEPALDLGCGTGRLLLAYLAAGLDVEGADASPDMLAWCERLGRERGLTPQLHCQPMHQLDLERHYRTIYMCGAFGLGGSRSDDLEGLRRVHAHLTPRGVFAMDHYLPNFNEREWQVWLPEHRPGYPTPWSRQPDKREAADGTHLALYRRVLEFDPLEQTGVEELRVDHTDGDRLIAREAYPIRMQIYLKNELLLMLRSAGFDDIEVTAGPKGTRPRPWEDSYLTLVAKKQ